MQGETLTEVDIVSKGLLGDRAYALWDVETQRVASAKNPRKWARLLTYQAAFQQAPTLADPLPVVRITAPEGAALDSDSTELAETLSHQLGRQVILLNTVPEHVSLDKYIPPNLPGVEREAEITQLFLPEGTFFDSCNVHLLTTSTLAKLQSLYPDGAFDPCRFRPNIMIEPQSQNGAEPDFIEESWVGSVLAIGEQVRLQIDTVCPRCVVTTLAQQGLPQDMTILRTTAIHNQVNAGIRASVVQEGRIQVGDPLFLE